VLKLYKTQIFLTPTVEEFFVSSRTSSKADDAALLNVKQGE